MAFPVTYLMLGVYPNLGYIPSKHDKWVTEGLFGVKYAYNYIFVTYS